MARGFNRVKVKIGDHGRRSSVVLVTAAGDFEIPMSTLQINVSVNSQTIGIGTLYIDEVEGELMPENVALEVRRLMIEGSIKVRGM